MTVMVPLAMFGIIPAAVVAFATLPARRALLAVLIGGWLFLPMASYSLHGFPDYTKVTATVTSALLGVVLFDAARLSRFRLRWFDLPMVLWCLVPLPSALGVGLGLYAGLSAVLQQVISWGLPYFLGRLYFNDAAGVRELAIAIVAGGLIYVPLCLYEVRMSPKLHYQVYGFIQHQWIQTIRYGGWRPMVFMQHGLAVGSWMALSTLTAVWLWRSGSVKRWWGLGMGWWAAALVVTTILCKSTGAWGLLAIGLAVMYVSRWTGWRVGLGVLIVIVPTYMFARATGVLPSETVLEPMRMVAPAARVASMQYRLEQEDVLSAHAMARPLLGWGPWGGFRRSQGKSLVKATDGLWIIVLGKYGVAGLASLCAVILLPAYLVLRRVGMRALTGESAGMLGALILALTLFMCDNLMNAMANPIFIVVAGALAGWYGAGALPAGRFIGRPVTVVQKVEMASGVMAATRKLSKEGHP